VTDSWPTVSETVRRLQVEAAAHAARLGHVLTEWSQVAARSSSARCTHCGDLARITVRIAAESPILGPATQLRCSGRAPAPKPAR
jgi:hypothetical protein